jgi:RHS repeat-associated protein
MATSQKKFGGPPSTSGGTQKLNNWNPFDKEQKESDQPAQPTSNHSAVSLEAKKSSSGEDSKSSYYTSTAPTINALAGGGALKSIDEKFKVNPVSGTCSLSVPFRISPGRNGLTPDVSLSYDSGSGNGPFGLGWTLTLPSISRKTSKGIPQYNDEAESDVFLFTGIEDLVPKLAQTSGDNPQFLEDTPGDWTVRQYWPRTEGGFTRLERWYKPGQPAETYWRTISPTNVTSLYGQTLNSKIIDQSDGRVFAWLLCARYDSCGNAIQYTYKEEDSTGVRLDQAHERHRTDQSRAVNRYIKSIKYGNTVPNRDNNWSIQPVPNNGWMFEVVFDYGDHAKDNPTSQPDLPWTVRDDPFSNYSASFEVRTYRLCRRVLLFHHLKELPADDYLVKSMDLSYNESGIVSVLSSITQSGHALDASKVPTTRSLPAMEFEYSTVDLTTASTKAVPPSAMQNLPVGLSSQIQWVDLDGIGRSSALIMQDTGWFRMKNLSTYIADYHDPSAGVGDVEFGPAEPMLKIPSTGKDGKAALLDLDGSGRLDLVRNELGQQGFYERTDEGGWTEFRSFPSWPIVDQKNPNLRYLDLTGDGLADIIISEADTFLWFPSLGTRGYGEGTRTYTGASEDDGPRLLFSDSLETIYLADFSGDGLVDLVRIRNGDVCYWPNIGYGRFGAKVTMDNAPWMDPLDRYNQGRILLADIDGSGVADILYFPSDGGLKLYFNLAGNGWSGAVDAHFPLLDSLSQVSILDLFGLGVSSVVWSTLIPGSQALSLNYLDFTHGLKPHLLTIYKNGPVETRIEYTSSVMFHLTDEKAGRPWPTRLSFPVQCVSQVKTYDYLSRSYSSSSNGYHDGYFDGLEREFRGFGKVETTTSEYFLLDRTSLTFPAPAELKGALTSPPTFRVAWYHTGTYECMDRARALYKTEYYGNSGLSDIAVSLTLPGLSTGMSAMETRQAYRALKGSPLHAETYLLDGSSKEHVPFTITDKINAVKMLQHSVSVIHPGVFLVTPRESVNCIIERNDADPKISHDITLEVDDFGNITKSVSVAYGRRSSFRTSLHTADDWKAQGTTVVMYTEQDFTNSISTADDFHTPLSSEVRAYEVNGLSPSSTLFTFDEVSTANIQGLSSKAYTDQSDSAGKRMITRQQTRYRANDLSILLDPGALQSMAIAGEKYTLAMTPDIFQAAFQASKKDPLLANTTILTDKTGSGAGYRELEPNTWWIPSGQQRLSPNEDATPAQELQTARTSFFQPMRFIDPFGKGETVTYDGYFMFPTTIVDPAGNTKQCVTDYRTLQPCLVTDENGNQTACVFDALGSCVGTAVMGKPSASLGDTKDGFQPFLDPPTLQQLIADPLKLAQSLLAKCTSFSFSDFPSFSTKTGWSPAFNVSVARDTSIVNLKNGGTLANLQVAVSYFDGRGQALQKRTLASVDAGPEQWVVNDCVVTNRVSGMVRQYDAFFDASHTFSRPTDAVFSTSFYDPAGRLVATVLPNHTWIKMVFAAWSQTSYDPGDTVTVDDPLTDPDVGLYLSGLENAAAMLQPTWYHTMSNSSNLVDRTTACHCKVYADTPSTVWVDALGQQFLSIINNGKAGKYITRSYKDVQGRVTKTIDAEGRLAGILDYDMIGAGVHAASMDTGDKWLLSDVTGKPIRSWNSRGIRNSTSYDKLRRPISCSVQNGDEPEFVSQRLVYGEDLPEPETNNLRGKLYQLSDQAVMSTIKTYDHLNNAVAGSQQLVKEYKAVVDWNKSVDLEDEIFTWSSSFDALRRLLTQTRTDGSVVTNTYNQRSMPASVQTTGIPGVAGSVVKDVQYNPRGQPIQVSYGNNTEAQFVYDPKTFMMLSKTTVGGSSTTVQDLHYTMDCMCRIARIDDLAQQTIFFRGDVVKPIKEYTFDAIGRLTKATGREHLGQTGSNWVCIPSSSSAASREDSPSDGTAMANYTENYTYSPEGNILSVTHSLPDMTTVSGWTRTYQYAEPSLLEAGKTNNRLTTTTVGTTASTYKYEGSAGAAGLMTSMSGFPILQYDTSDRLSATSTQLVTNGGTAETTYYRYDSSNKRVRKVTERYAAAGQTPVRLKDHLYVDGAEVEIFRKFDGTDSNVTSERWTWHVRAAGSRVALSEADPEGSRVVLIEANKGLNGTGNFENVITRYVVSDHLSSVSLELDDSGEVLSFEEFSPYGATTYDAAVSLKVGKRYRFSAKERDTETGLYYFENRYLIPWLGRWLSPDPLGTQDGLNVYCYVSCDPINKIDPTGLAGDDPAEPQPQGQPQQPPPQQQQVREFQHPVFKAAAQQVGQLANQAATAATAAGLSPGPIGMVMRILQPYLGHSHQHNEKDEPEQVLKYGVGQVLTIKLFTAGVFATYTGVRGLVQAAGLSQPGQTKAVADVVKSGISQGIGIAPDLLLRMLPLTSTLRVALGTGSVNVHDMIKSQGIAPTPRNHSLIKNLVPFPTTPRGLVAFGAASIWFAAAGKGAEVGALQARDAAAVVATNALRKINTEGKEPVFSTL